MDIATGFRVICAPLVLWNFSSIFFEINNVWCVVFAVARCVIDFLR